MPGLTEHFRGKRESNIKHNKMNNRPDIEMIAVSPPVQHFRKFSFSLPEGKCGQYHLHFWSDAFQKAYNKTFRGLFLLNNTCLLKLGLMNKEWMLPVKINCAEYKMDELGDFETAAFGDHVFQGRQLNLLLFVIGFLWKRVFILFLFIKRDTCKPSVDISTIYLLLSSAGIHK